MVNKKLINKILDVYTLPIDGIHGVGHWARVLENGRMLADENSADIKVVSLFAILHDSRRLNEGRDFEHGQRAVEFLYETGYEYLNLTDQQFGLLCEACCDHTKGRTKADITIQTCWDADRLDLGRVGIRPDKKRLCTDAAKGNKILQWANRNAEYEFIPTDILADWGIANR